MGKKCSDRLDRWMESRRQKYQAQLAKSPPLGYRTSDDGTHVVPLGDRAWPARPFEPMCPVFRDPDIELATLARQFVDDFDPGTNPLSWPLLKELVLHEGRRVSEVEQMSLEDIKPFLIHLAATKVGGRRRTERGGTDKNGGVSRQGRGKRLTKIDFEEMLTILYRRRPETIWLAARELVPIFLEEFGSDGKVSYRTISATDVYGEQRDELKLFRHLHGKQAALEARNALLQFSAQKPGRGDKRIGADGKHEKAVRDFLRKKDQILESAERRVAMEKRERAARGKGKKTSPSISFPEKDFFAE